MWIALWITRLVQSKETKDHLKHDQLLNVTYERLFKFIANLIYDASLFLYDINIIFPDLVEYLIRI